MSDVPSLNMSTPDGTTAETTVLTFSSLPTHTPTAVSGDTPASAPSLAPSPAFASGLAPSLAAAVVPMPSNPPSDPTPTIGTSHVQGTITVTETEEEVSEEEEESEEEQDIEPEENDENRPPALWAVPGTGILLASPEQLLEFDVYDILGRHRATEEPPRSQYHNGYPNYPVPTVIERPRIVGIDELVFR